MIGNFVKYGQRLELLGKKMSILNNIQMVHRALKNCSWGSHTVSVLASSCSATANSVPAFQVFISVSVILGDGLYNLIKIIYATIKEVMNARSKQGRLPLVRVHDGKAIFLLYGAHLPTNDVPLI